MPLVPWSGKEFRCLGTDFVVQDILYKSQTATKCEEEDEEAVVVRRRRDEEEDRVIPDTKFVAASDCLSGQPLFQTSSSPLRPIVFLLTTETLNDSTPLSLQLHMLVRDSPAVRSVPNNNFLSPCLGESCLETIPLHLVINAVIVIFPFFAV